MTNFLDSMKFPEDLNYLNEEELTQLAKEIRKFLVQSVSKTGGHLASNLGVVDLTISLFRCFDIEKDKIIWDVGHQSYVHKILTGRKDQFDKLRKKDGLSGFPKRNESRYDAFDTGHSSTSISAALGMARARDLQGKDFNVVAVIGDGALTGGMALEALNDAGFNKTNMIIILNDNQMSISKNVGGLSSYLNNIRLEPVYNKIKNEINETLNYTAVGKTMATSLSKLKGSIKQLLVPSMLFEDMGIKYLGPIDGHNIAQMKEVFNKAKKLPGPVIIHTITKKGKGYSLAEENPSKFHGVSSFDTKKGISKTTVLPNYSDEFGQAMIEIAGKNENVVAITAAMPDGTGLKKYSHDFPSRFFDVGIAEQHAVTLAAGMACSGIKPVVAIYSTFLQRAFDQILHDVCIQNLPVVFCIDRAGIVGADGETHQGLFDISYLSIIPNITIVAPKCVKELGIILRWAVEYKDGPIAIRYPKGGDCLDFEPLTKVNYGKWETLNQGNDIAIIATGRMVQNSVQAMNLLSEEDVSAEVINATFIKPLDKKMLEELSNRFTSIITVEDNIANGGFGAMVLSELSKNGYKGNFNNLAYNDVFIHQGNIEQTYIENGLDAEGIKKSALKLLSRN